MLRKLIGGERRDQHHGGPKPCRCDRRLPAGGRPPARVQRTNATLPASADAETPITGNSESPAMTFKAQIAGRRKSRSGEKGVVAIEFALLAPVLLLLLLGAIQFGLVLRNYVILTNAVSVTAMQFAISRSDTKPASDAWTAITSAAPTLTPTTNLEMTLSVGSPATACLSNANSVGTAESADSACQTALSNAAPTSGGTLQPSTVTATFPCGSELTWINFWSSTCKLTSTMTQGVQ
jgi:Flp pilus assembly protein TadG